MFREAILEVFGSIETMITEMSDERYVAVTEATTAEATKAVVVMRFLVGDLM